ncbi:UNVERIFIED_CONTAM: hypothetical protein K2H54_034293 [Gekko kuhli]
MPPSDLISLHSERLDPAHRNPFAQPIAKAPPTVPKRRRLKNRASSSEGADRRGRKSDGRRRRRSRRSCVCRARVERGETEAATMPCRRTGGERFLLLERAVALQSSPVGGSIGSKEVDALVAKLGEVLQLSAQHRTPPPRLPRHHGRDRAAPYSAPRGLGFLASLHRQPPHQRPPPSLLLLPPPPPSSASTDKKGSPRVAKQLCGRGWLRSAARAGGKKPRRHPLLPAGDDDEEEDPHRLLQQLILSGNLIKEAVRRLQLAASTAAGETSTTGSPSSASSAGSCHSSSGEGDSAVPPATTAAFPVSSLPPLP